MIPIPFLENTSKLLSRMDGIFPQRIFRLMRLLVGRQAREAKGRISEERLRVTCAASPEAFCIVQVKELPSSVDHFADGLP